MANLKDIKTRIVTVKKTRQITQAMKLVAAAKMKRATDAATNAKPYKEQLTAVLARVSERAGEVNEPLLTRRSDVKRILVVLLTSDRGLCGGFNNNLSRFAHRWLTEKKESGVEITLHCYGRKGATQLRGRGWKPENVVVGWSQQAKMDLVRPLSDQMVMGFVEGRFDEVYVISNDFVSALNQVPRAAMVVPVTMDDAEAESVSGDYRYEPDAPQILGALLPLYIRTLMLQFFLETEAGEHAARMAAMDSATRNASDLIDRLTLEYNRARQAAITTEIIEIVSGAAAL